MPANLITGTAGNDNLTGTSGDDTFNLAQGGNDTVQGLAGNDLFLFGATFTAADSIDGGTGADVLRLAGDYSAGVTFGAATMVNVETIQLTAGNSYKLTTDDANVAAGALLKVDAHTLGTGDSLIFNGSAENDGKFQVTGGAGADTLTGGAGNDTFILTGGGTDTVKGGDGNDTIQMGATLTAADQINGGTGNDTVTLDGDYSAGVTLASSAFVNVEALTLAAGHSYTITTDGTVTNSGLFTIDAGDALGASDVLNLTAGGPGVGDYDIIAGAGNDVIVDHGSHADIFDLSHGGTDTVTGGTGGNIFLMGAALTVADTLDGGSGDGVNGDNILELNGDYSGANALTLAGSTLTDFTLLRLDAGHDYTITENNGNIAAGKSWAVDASAVGSGHSAIFNGAAETNGAFSFSGGLGTNVFTGGAKNDQFFGNGGLDTFTGGTGNDTFTMNALFTAADRIDGGAGTNLLVLTGAHNGNVVATFDATTMVNIAQLDFVHGTGAGSVTFDITTDDANVAAGATLIVSARTDTAQIDSFIFNGSAETDGHFDFLNDSGTETFIGGALSDTFDLTHRYSASVTGGGGADMFIGTSTAGQHQLDTFNYNAVSDSTSAGYDTIHPLNLAGALFHTSNLGGATTGIDASVTTGALSAATFDADLAGDVGAGQLAAHHAMLFTANAGTLSGHTFLVVDENGTAGYQAGADLVIDVTGLTGTLTTANFS